MRLGFVGLGDQGAPIARQLIDAGHPVMLWARRPETLDPFLNTTATMAPDLKAMAQACDWIGICVFDDAGVIEICEAIFPHMRKDASVVVHSTVHPDTCMAMAQKANDHGLHFVDAPVSGGHAAAVAGTLTIMAGALPEAFAVSEPVFACYGGLIRRLGDVGAGQAAKLINNMLLAANFALGSAALEAADELGVDRTTMTEIVNASTGRSFGFSVIAAMKPENLPRAAAILGKDVGLFASCVSAEQAITPFVQLTQAYMEKAGRG